MYTDIKRLTAATAQIAAAAAAVYTAPAGKRAQLGTIVLHNTNTTAETVVIYDNGAADANKLLNISLATNESYEFSPKVPIVLEGAETLQAITTTAAKVNIKIYGREEA